MTTEKEKLEAAKVGCLVILLSPVFAVLRAWSIVTVWPWFLPGHVSLPVAAGAVFILNFVTAKPIAGKKTDYDFSNYTLATALGEKIGGPLLFVGLGWILRAFVWWWVS